MMRKSFDSKLVRLKAIIPASVKRMRKRFDSKLVRLKEDTSLFSEFLIKTFRFQTGSIKSKLEPGTINHLPRFDSKLVRLKADADDKEKSKLFGFDSKLVRLKDHESVPRRASDFSSFDSKLVRLKGSCMARFFTSRKLFRFQTGSIKSCFYTPFDLIYQRCFDSKLVRLKGCLRKRC